MEKFRKDDTPKLNKKTTWRGHKTLTKETFDQHVEDDESEATADADNCVSGIGPKGVDTQNRESSDDQGSTGEGVGDKRS